MAATFKGMNFKGTNLQFDPEFQFLLDLDPAFDGWRSLAAEWWQAVKKDKPLKQSALCVFFVTYLHGLGLDKAPQRLLDASKTPPNPLVTLGLGAVSTTRAKRKHDIISDFLDWVLHEKFSEPDADGHHVIPIHLRNPFPRKSPKNWVAKTADNEFQYVLSLDPSMRIWQKYAAEYVHSIREGQTHARSSLSAFLKRYIIQNNLDRDPLCFLRRSTPKPSLIEALLTTKGQLKKSKNTDLSGKPTQSDIRINTICADFIDWVLLQKLSVEGDYGEKIVPSEFHNPVERLSQVGIARPNETAKNALPMHYIRRLRTMLAEGETFRDWTWAQTATDAHSSGGDWFIVDPAIINRDDPDCVWRERRPSLKERKGNNLPEIVIEIWSPVRAVALYTKLELPLRTHQVRFLDSGEGDTWRYVWDVMGGRFDLNDTPLASGSEARPCQRGLFYRQAGAKGAGFFINTNKTADINKPEDQKGYVIPWTHITLLYWLEKLRTWQERYNPVETAMPWTALDAKYFAQRPAEAILAERSPAFFLFRDPTRGVVDTRKPLAHHALKQIWYKLLAQLEACLAAKTEMDASGTPVRLVDPYSRSNTYFPLHSLRVSLITGLIMDGGLPIEVVSKLIAGHHGLIQTIYYTKIGIDHMNKLMADAEHKMNEAESRSHKLFLMKHARDDINQRFASVSEDGVTAAMSQKSEAGFVFDDKGVCPVGCAMCDVGGALTNNSDARPTYAPVPGYPHERNCIRCRFFITGPAWLDALNAKFNNTAYQALQTAERYNRFAEQVAAMEERRADCEAKGKLFTESTDLEKMSQRLEAETETQDRWISDLQSVQRLINRSIAINKNAAKDGLQLVAVGTLFDIQAALTVTESELHPIEIQCRNATIYPEIDARQPTMRRSQLLDILMAVNKTGIQFSRLSVEQQLYAGNATMKLIEARAGSIENAVEFVEARGRLKALGIVNDDLIKTLSSCDDQGIAMTEIICNLRAKKALAAPHEKEEEDAS